MNQELKALLTKQNIGMIIFAVIAFAWLNSVVAGKYQVDARQHAVEILASSYYSWQGLPMERDELMRRYGITDDEINPNRLLRLGE